jgi:hypothetical protein
VRKGKRKEKEEKELDSGRLPAETKRNWATTEKKRK